MNDSEDRVIYKVVVNREEQYSLWPIYRENASGWTETGKIGTKAECLAYIEDVWTEIRLLRMRKRIEEFYR